MTCWPEPQVEAALDRLEGRACQMFVGQDAGLRGQHLVARRDLGDRVAEPADGAVVGQSETLVDGRAEAVRPRLDLAPEGFEGRRIESPRGLACRLRVRA